MIKRTIGLVVLCFAAVFAYYTFRPVELKGSASVYNVVTLQLTDNLFYDVRVPVEAKLLSTDGGTVYTYDLLTVGIQDVEPSAHCKVKLGDRWVFATSEDGWLKATIAGFEELQPYEGTYDDKDIKWTGAIPKVVVDLDESLLKALSDGSSKALGGNEFITTQVAYGTFDVAKVRALTRMSTLYKQNVKFGMKTGSDMWVSSGDYTVAVHSLNYNTCVVISACGETGRQYAAAIMGRNTNEEKEAVLVH